jgi:hypothetical protein
MEQHNRGSSVFCLFWIGRGGMVLLVVLTLIGCAPQSETLDPVDSSFATPGELPTDIPLHDLLFPVASFTSPPNTIHTPIPMIEQPPVEISETQRILISSSPIPTATPTHQPTATPTPYCGNGARV